MSTVMQSPSLKYGDTFNCAECAKPVVFSRDGITTNCAYRPDGARICLDCARKGEREIVRKREKYRAYIAQDGRTVCDWRGNKLGDAERIGSVRLTRRSYAHGSEMSSYRVTDIFGQEWYTRGSPGIVCTLLPIKRKPRDRYAAELTDSFGGEANYSWVRRASFDVPAGASTLAVVRAAKRALNVTAERTHTDDFGDHITLRFVGACMVAFIRAAYEV